MDDLARRVQELGWAVRPARDDDAAAVTALIAGVYAEYPGCVLDEAGVDSDLATWASHLAAAGGTGWVVTDGDGRVRACVGVAPTTTPPALAPAAPSAPGATVAWVELKRLYVHAAARQRGLGGALVDRVEQWGRRQGATAVVLWSDDRFDDAHRLYTRHGYVDTGRRRDLHDPSGTTEIEFVRRL